MVLFSTYDVDVDVDVVGLSLEVGVSLLKFGFQGQRLNSETSWKFSGFFHSYAGYGHYHTWATPLLCLRMCIREG